MGGIISESGNNIKHPWKAIFCMCRSHTFIFIA